MMWSSSHGILQCDDRGQWHFVLLFLCEKYVERLFNQKSSTLCKQNFIVLIDLENYELFYFFKIYLLNF